MLNKLLGCLCIEGISFPLNNFQGIHRAFAHTGGKAITVIVGNELCLSIHKLYRSLCAGFHALTTAITSSFIYLNDLSLDFHVAS
jgi:hypothetical protein